MVSWLAGCDPVVVTLHAASSNAGMTESSKYKEGCSMTASTVSSRRNVIDGFSQRNPIVVTATAGT